LLVAGLAAGFAPSRDEASTMPAGYEAYHTYAEVVAFLYATVASYPHIAMKFSSGRSYHGREIWALKISDNVQLDEDEPEVLFDSLTHARERLTVEMSIYLIRLLTDAGSPLTVRTLTFSPDGSTLLVSTARDGTTFIRTRDGEVSSFSSRGDASRPATWPDISAPGSNITSACRLYLVICATGLDP
jgi:hypothetical protein